ncbi:MAG: isoleucine--tRNA ligase [Solibacterales bacterium]|nr:isoleucine--tRNA ligase [Bryobacterales bacterium]
MSVSKFDKAKPIVDFPELEASIGKFWVEHEIFEKSLRNREGCPKFIFYEGPPTANGLPHNGHVLTRVIKDIFLRYRTMCGFYVPRKAGWDTHGLPVEVEVEKELGIHGKEAIEEYGVKKFILKCMQSVFRYTEQWEKMTNRVGFWVDLEDAYVTYHKSYVESVWWALSELFHKDLLYQGHKIVWWWPQGGTALSAGEVGLGYKEVEDPSVYVALELEDEPGTHLLIWTTTPWTLPANQYVAVKEDYDYVQVRDDAHSIILAADLRETIAEKLGRELPIEKEIKGIDLVGRRYRPPLDYYTKRYCDLLVKSKAGDSINALWTVLSGDFVELDQGTGLVHEAPAFGEVDYELFLKTRNSFVDGQKIPLLCPVGPDGKFTNETPDLEGVFVKDADRLIIAKLKEEGVLLHRENYRHDYPFCWRADNDPLIQYARPAWFVRTTEHIRDAIANNESAKWLPEHIGTGRFGDFLTNNVDWALSRERYWGTPLNIWINDQTGNMQAPSSVKEIESKNPEAFLHFKKEQQDNPDLSDHLMVHKPWIDEVTWVEPNEPGVYRRIPEVIDCWFDSGCMPFAQFGYPHKGGKEFEDSFPADFITEAIDQTRGWFYSQLMISTLVFDKKTQQRCGFTEERDYPHPFRTCIVLGHVTDPTGKKESKSKGNYTPPEVIFDRVINEFAVVSSEKAGMPVKEDEVLLCREEVQALDATPGTVMKLSTGSLDGRSKSFTVQQAKKLPRRVAVISTKNCSDLALSSTPSGLNVQPNDVTRLPANQKLTLESTHGSAPGADAFRWFFFAANPPWSPTRHSLSNVRMLQKELPLKLRNVYSFFTIYANIDSFDPVTTTGQPLKKRTLLDRWILSETALVNSKVKSLMDNYSVYEAAEELSSFVDALSNWYLRRSRRRYWKSEQDIDKQDAYATLYQALTTVTNLVAPFVPFLAEEIYQNLVRKPFGNQQPESVHLCDFSVPDEAAIDHKLSDEMAFVRSIVSLGLRVRTDHKLKVRQPLSLAEIVLSDESYRAALENYRDLIAEELNVQEVTFVGSDEGHVRYAVRPNFRRLGPRLGKKMPIAKKAFQNVDASQLRHDLLSTGKIEMEIGDETITLNAEDVEVLVESTEDYAAAGDQQSVVVLNTNLTEELLQEGLYRELLRRIQDLRKELNVEYTSRIKLSIEASQRIKSVLEIRRKHFMEETLCTTLNIEKIDSNQENYREIEISGETVMVVLSLH